ncbi:A/G-specific adenine glycosylase [Candidatus Schneideria nysicola]|uniref:A/G-specific adenine glycosylase n=1 Tax=Candidatus Schneideria nysicola TaxID=1081631 RepID=UPI001CAA707F|nr:A/G-specific adenine glycosylase [Candidatus Schneideria nysicola]UAJ65590.1 A/G-specific adenine glycosylase [Candidatus Schneideria nysicola]
MKDQYFFVSQLLNWYSKYGRHSLPWQRDKTPYKVWLSEIMLQQTQVKTVIPYFQRFIIIFPNFKELALSSLDLVMYEWTGLGYYNRAYNLHKTAKIVHEKYNGELPSDLYSLLSLPGIGRSTAGAILSFAFNKRYSILDTNVKRVLIRYYMIEGYPNNKIVENYLWKLLDELMPVEHSTQFNQAMMDIGAQICTHSNPKCIICPLHIKCQSYLKKCWMKYPIKKIKEKLPRKSTWFLILQSKNTVWLEKRSLKGIWGGLFCFPQFPDLEKLEIFILNKGVQISQYRKLSTINHSFSHFHIDIHPIFLNISNIRLNLNERIGFWFHWKVKPFIGLSTPVRYLLKKVEQIN